MKRTLEPIRPSGDVDDNREDKMVDVEEAGVIDLTDSDNLSVGKRTKEGPTTPQKRKKTAQPQKEDVNNSDGKTPSNKGVLYGNDGKKIKQELLDRYDNVKTGKEATTDWKEGSRSEKKGDERYPNRNTIDDANQ